MFQEIHENIFFLCLLFAISATLCALIFIFVGIFAKTRGISLKFLLIGEKYVLAITGSVVIFLLFSFPSSLLVWFCACVAMWFVFKEDWRLISYFSYCDAIEEEEIARLSVYQLKSIPKRIPDLESERVFSWIKDFRSLRRETLKKINGDFPRECLKLKYRMLPFSVFASGTIGIGISFLVYDTLIQNKNSLCAVLIENYVLVTCLLYVLYWLFYFAEVKYIWGSFCGSKKQYKAIFAVWAVIAYAAVTYISMNWNYTGR